MTAGQNNSKTVVDDASQTQVIAAEPEKSLGHVKEKIREGRYNRKPPSTGSRARKAIRGSLAKIIKKAASITDLLTEHDQQENLRVIRQAKKATHRIYDGEQKRLVEVPDHKTRLAAVTLELAYTEGRPVERQITATAKFESLEELQARLRQSPTFNEWISSQKTLETKEIMPTLPESQGAEH